ncbi:solute carrier family 16 member 6b [Salminus brasiliensis]|uniref:solute carrier family 16 member 6b n=1 Tax=Salminus brasiliensis TaxID=930266 RepID=UPI003B832D6E
MKGQMPTMRACMSANVYPQVPDGGWGWAVAMAFFFTEVFTYGIIKIFGIFLQDFTNHFEESNSRVSWIVSICVFVMTFTAPLSTVLSNRFGCRPVVMFGGFLISLGTISTAFTHSINQMYITVGLVSGLGYCLTFLPTVTILSQYFNKRRSLVTSVASTGECFSLFALTPALSILKAHVGWRNCLVVIGLMQASLIAFGALLKPIIIQPQPTSPEEDEEEEGPQSPLKQPEAKYEQENEFTRTSFSSVDSGVQSISSSRSNLAEGQSPSRNAAERGSEQTTELELQEVREEVEPPPLPSTPLKQPTKQLEQKEQVPREARPKLLDFSVLRDCSFICYSLFGLFATLGFFAPQLYIIDLSVSCGLERNQATYMLSTMAVAEIFGRLSIGWVLNRRPIRKIYILLICTALLSLVLALFTAVSEFWGLACCCAACGFLFGTVGSTHIPMLAEDDVVGIERMSSAVGVYVFIQSFAGLAGPPLAGALVDLTLNYGSAFYTSAAGVGVGALFLGLVRPTKLGLCTCRRKSVTQEEKQENTHSEDTPADFLEVDLAVESSPSKSQMDSAAV